MNLQIKSSIIAIWGRWLEAVDVRLPDTVFWGKSSVRKNVISQSWRKFLVAAILEGIENLMKLCQQNYLQVQMFHILADLYVKIAKKKNFLWVFLIKLS